MKKLLALILTVLMLTACASGSSDTPTARKNSTANEPANSFTSSIFGRNVKYDAMTPAEGLALPIPPDEILEMAQIEKRLYFLGGGAVHSLDIETGESNKLFDTSTATLAAHGGKLYTYTAEASTISEYDPAGGTSKGIALEIIGVDSVDGLWVTDDYYIFKCRIEGEVFIETYLFIYSRETNELTMSQKMSRSGIYLYPYKGNKLLAITINPMSGYDLGAFDVETCKNEKLLNLSTVHRPAVAYCPKTDTVIVYGVPSRYLEGGKTLDGDSPCCITEYSLADTDNVVHNRYFIDVSFDTKFFISVYENIISAVTTAESECRIFDYLKPPKSITVLGHAIIQDVVYGFEQETGILVKNAYTDFDKMILKLMAGDSDFDIFYSGSEFHNFVDADTYVDLKGIESLNSRISGNAAADLALSYNGKYFGVPTSLRNYYTEEFYPEDGSVTSYSLVASENIYYARSVDVAEQRYSDPDGEELYKLFKYIYDNPEGSKKKMPFGDEVTILTSGALMLNPKSQNSDSAIRFLEYVFDCLNGDIPGIVPEDNLYQRLESIENCYVEWRCKPIDIILPIFDARNAIHAQRDTLSKSDLKKMARETAAEVAMRMGE